MPVTPSTTQAGGCLQSPGPIPGFDCCLNHNIGVPSCCVLRRFANGSATRFAKCSLRTSPSATTLSNSPVKLKTSPNESQTLVVLHVPGLAAKSSHKTVDL